MKAPDEVVADSDKVISFMADIEFLEQCQREAQLEPTGSIKSNNYYIKK
jgi:hypothetical protein